MRGYRRNKKKVGRLRIGPEWVCRECQTKTGMLEVHLKFWKRGDMWLEKVWLTEVWLVKVWLLSDERHLSNFHTSDSSESQQPFPFTLIFSYLNPLLDSSNFTNTQT